MAVLSPQVAAVGPALLEADRFTPLTRRRLSSPGLRTFLSIADLWGLNEGERLLSLGLPSRSTYYGWVRAAREHREITLDLDVLTRISIILGIHQALGVLNESETDALGWLRTGHRAPIFGGQTPLSVLTSGPQDAMMAVRRFLDAARGGFYMPPNELDRDFAPLSDANVAFL